VALRLGYGHGEPEISQVKVFLSISWAAVEQDVIWLDVEVQNSVFV
jgi:hypothetical protein